MAYKRKTGGGNDKSLPAGKKRSDNSTSYNKKDMTHSGSAKPPKHPYGQPHKAVKKK